MNYNSRLIPELLGYKLKPCNNGFAWESPFVKHVDDLLQIHGRLFRGNDEKYKFCFSVEKLLNIIKFIADKTDYELIIGYDWSEWKKDGKNPLNKVFGGYGNGHEMHEPILEAILEFAKYKIQL